MTRSLSQLAAWLTGMLLWLCVLPTVVSADVRQVTLATNDLVYDAFRQRIYASVPSSGGARANTVTGINPNAGELGPSIPVAPNPSRLALSDDGRYLYAALDGAAAVRRVELGTQRAGLQFSLGNNPSSGPYLSSSGA
jgi:DNA-binding beta-propeller fold protein YncE